jgi:hypothetical protein
MYISKQQRPYVYLLILGFIVGMCAGCAVPNYYPNISKPSPFAKKLSKSEKSCPGNFYANRNKRSYGN